MQQRCSQQRRVCDPTPYATRRSFPKGWISASKRTKQVFAYRSGMVFQTVCKMVRPGMYHAGYSPGLPIHFGSLHSRCALSDVSPHAGTYAYNPFPGLGYAGHVPSRYRILCLGHQRTSCLLTSRRAQCKNFEFAQCAGTLGLLPTLSIRACRRRCVLSLASRKAASRVLSGHDNRKPVAHPVDFGNRWRQERRRARSNYNPGQTGGASAAGPFDRRSRSDRRLKWVVLAQSEFRHCNTPVWQLPIHFQTWTATAMSGSKSSRVPVVLPTWMDDTFEHLSQRTNRMAGF